MQRREVLAVIGITAVAELAGCNSLSNSAESAHTVSVYLGDRELTRNVTVTISSADGSTLFEDEYRLSDSNEADEDATFPASDDPDRIIVTVDGIQFEREWPGFENPELPCDDPNHTGIEIWIEQTENGSPEIRLEANCQSVTLDE